ncbi:poly(A) polymerase-like [Hoplias malabaricus]|uniref:poly(A) polymerase-like n=1 Tax=Hoplias malabaricus TaxID=27720 RepID=UPI0034627EF1
MATSKNIPTSTITTTTTTTPTGISSTPTTTTTTITTASTTAFTTTTTTTIPAQTRPPPAVALQIVIQQVYVVELADPQSAAFQTLAVEVIASFDVVYKTRYGSLFLRTIVLAFRPGTTRAQNVEADVQLIFNENSTKPLPDATDIVSTLKNAISNPSSGFNLTVDLNSITVVSVPQTVSVIFLTNGTFVTALSDSNSSLFANRSIMIKTGLEPFFTADYPSVFSSLTISNFSDGGFISNRITTIQNSMVLSFGASATVPISTQIGQTIIRAAKNNSLPFQIFTSKIIVNGTVISSGNMAISINMSIFTASFMVVLSLLITSSS